jgi:hypothetical protein
MKYFESKNDEEDYKLDESTTTAKKSISKDRD